MALRSMQLCDTNYMHSFCYVFMKLYRNYQSCAVTVVAVGVLSTFNDSSSFISDFAMMFLIKIIKQR